MKVTIGFEAKELSYKKSKSVRLKWSHTVTLEYFNIKEEALSNIHRHPKQKEFFKSKRLKQRTKVDKLDYFKNAS